MSKNNHAVVFGASGTAGWGVVDSLMRNYPSKGTYTSVTALTNRPLDPETTLWPTGPEHPKLNLISGVNLTAGTHQEFTEDMRLRIPDVSSVTHVFYYAYTEIAVEQGADAEKRVNKEMLERVVEAFEVLSPNFSMLIYPGGAKAYGVHHGGGLYEPPYREDAPRMPSPYADSVNYYVFRDYLNARSKGKKWSWSEICPDAVIGYTPNGSQFSLVALWGSYLSLYAAVHGKGAKVHFPGDEGCWKGLFNEASSEMIGKESIWAALNPDKSSGQVFNVVDNAKPHNWEDNWPKLAAYFNLEGVGPVEGASMKTGPLPSKFVLEHKDILEKNGIKANAPTRADFLDMYGYHMGYDRYFSTEKIRNAGFAEEVDPIEGWFRTWDNFKKTGFLLK